MKISFSNILVVILILCVAALSAVMLIGDSTPPPAPSAPVQEKKPPAKAAIGEAPEANVRALKSRIRQLEAELAAARAAVPEPVTNAAPGAQQPAPQQANFRPPNPREWMEDLKKNNPKKYEEMQQRFARFRQHRLERTQGRLDYLGSIETSGMTDEEKTNHEKLQELLAQRENLPEPSENMTDEEMRASMQQRHELDRAIRKANEMERTTLLKQTAGALGLSGDDATVMTEAIQEIIRTTESDRGPHGPPPR